MTATVLVPLDGSDKDGRALPVAVSLAHLTDGAVHLIRVRDADAQHLSAAGGDRSDSDASHRLGDVTKRGLSEAAEHLASLVARAVTWEVTYGGDVATVLLGRAQELSADIVVMATRAPGPVGRAIYGSVADRVVRESTRPVVLVPPGADFLRGKQVQLRRVLVPLDGSDAALQVLAHLLNFAGARELELVLLEVVVPSQDHLQAREAEHRLTVVADRVRARGAAADVRVIEAGDPADVIVDAIRQELVDFIAMATRGTRGLERHVLGSVATEVVRRSEVSVLLVTRA